MSTRRKLERLRKRNHPTREEILAKLKREEEYIIRERRRIALLRWQVEQQTKRETEKILTVSRDVLDALYIDPTRTPTK